MHTQKRMRTHLGFLCTCIVAFVAGSMLAVWAANPTSGQSDVEVKITVNGQVTESATVTHGEALSLVASATCDDEPLSWNISAPWDDLLANKSVTDNQPSQITASGKANIPGTYTVSATYKDTTATISLVIRPGLDFVSASDSHAPANGSSLVEYEVEGLPDSVFGIYDWRSIQGAPDISSEHRGTIRFRGNNAETVQFEAEYKLNGIKSEPVETSEVHFWAYEIDQQGPLKIRTGRTVDVSVTAVGGIVPPGTGKWEIETDNILYTGDGTCAPAGGGLSHQMTTTFTGTKAGKVKLKFIADDGEGSSRVTAESYLPSIEIEISGEALNEISVNCSHYPKHGRISSGETLEVVSQEIGDTITCLAIPMDQDEYQDGYPKWHVVAPILDREGEGTEFKFRALGPTVTANLLFLWAVPPNSYTVKCKDVDGTEYSATVLAYPSVERSKTFKLPDPLKEGVKKIESIPVIGKYLEFKKFSGSLTYSNAWKEKENGSTEAIFAWGGKFIGSAGAEIKVPLVETTFAGVPPDLVQAGIYFWFTGSIGGGVQAKRDIGGLTIGGIIKGNVSAFIGGAIDIVDGFASITLRGGTGITGTFEPVGQAEPPKFSIKGEIAWDGLFVEYTTEWLWGAFEDTETWTVVEGSSLLSGEKSIIPWE